MAQGYKGEIPFTELCRLIYEGFGEPTVTHFILGARVEGNLGDVVAAWCDACDDVLYSYNNACLICGTRTEETGQENE